MRGLADFDPEVCHVVYKSRQKISYLLLSLLWDGDTDLRFDVIVTHFTELHRKKVSGYANSFGVDQFVGSPLLDLEVMRILEATCKTEFGPRAWSRLKMVSRFGRCASGMRDMHLKGQLGNALRSPIVLRQRPDCIYDSLPGTVDKYINTDKDGGDIEGVSKGGVLKHLPEQRTTSRVTSGRTLARRKPTKNRRLKPWRHGTNHTVAGALLGIAGEQAMKKDEDVNVLAKMVVSAISKIGGKGLDIDDDELRLALKQELSRKLHDTSEELFSDKGLKCDLDEFMEHFDVKEDNDSEDGSDGGGGGAGGSVSEYFTDEELGANAAGRAPALIGDTAEDDDALLRVPGTVEVVGNKGGFPDDVVPEACQGDCDDDDDEDDDVGIQPVIPMADIADVTDEVLNSSAAAGATEQIPNRGDGDGDGREEDEIQPAKGGKKNTRATRGTGATTPGPKKRGRMPAGSKGTEKGAKRARKGK